MDLEIREGIMEGLGMMNSERVRVFDWGQRDQGCISFRFGPDFVVGLGVGSDQKKVMGGLGIGLNEIKGSIWFITTIHKDHFCNL